MKFEGRSPKSEDKGASAARTRRNCGEWREVIWLGVCGTLTTENERQVDAHVAACAECHRYAEELRATTASLRWLASAEVEPSAGFRRRWMHAVEDAAQPWTLAGTFSACGEWLRNWLSRNLRPAAAVAGLWFLTLLFRLNAPDASLPAKAALAQSPGQIMRLLKEDQRLLAWHFWKQDQPAAPAVKAKPAQPRSSLHHDPSHSSHESHLIHTVTA